MDFLDTVKSSLNTAVDTISAVTHTIIEKNRTNAQLNRLRLVMKNESEMINRAYIALGKHYYENSGKGEEFLPAKNESELFNVIETSKCRIKKARERYNLILENQSIEIFDNYDKDTIEDITVACSNEDEYAESPFPVKEEKPEMVEDITVAAKDMAEEVKDTVSDVATEVKETVTDAAEEAMEAVSDAVSNETDEDFSF
ncbi:MAG: hypothetical protein J1E56_06885 [Ruminococcus sp.]|nr:hypothetical protein [Ruminococcus sp.]